MTILKDIYLIRHGETHCNRLGMVQGRGINAPLNEAGHAQAAAFFLKYHHVPFDKIYTSSLLRTQETVAPFTNLGIPTEAHAGLDEISWGDYEGQIASQNDRPNFHKMVARWRTGETHIAIDGGESPLDVALRQEGVIELILSRKDERNVLVCMHGRAMKILLCQLFDKPLMYMDRFSHSNCCLYHLRLIEGHGLVLHKENCQHHLETF